MEPVNGLQVLEAAREQDPDLIAIILTAHGSLESAVETLRLGAFDYLFKPAAPDTIRQRVAEGIEKRRKILRRKILLNQIESLRQTLIQLDDTSLNAPSNRFIRSGKLVLDRHHRQATLAETLLDLTTTEFDILQSLVISAPAPLSARELVNMALDYDCEDMEARDIIKWHIHHLRRKIEQDASRPEYIKTIRHHGYLWAGNQ